MSQPRKTPVSQSGRLPQRPSQPPKAAFRNDVFADEAAYDRAVASVVARIKSGAVPARQPDEE